MEPLSTNVKDRPIYCNDPERRGGKQGRGRRPRGISKVVFEDAEVLLCLESVNDEVRRLGVR